MIGKLIAHALVEALQEMNHFGPPIELNDAAKAAHKEHRDIVDLIIPELQAAELAMTKAKNRLEEERQRWALAMRIAQPQTAEGEGFEINDANTHFRIKYETEAESKAAATPGQPEWVKEIIGNKPN